MTTIPGAPSAPAPVPGYPRDASLHELFAKRAAAQPDAVAARHHGRTLTYGALDSRSDDLAARLRAGAVAPGSMVGVCGERSLDALIAFLGILKSGCAYVPLDDAQPPARLRAMAEDADVRDVVVLPGSVCRIRGLRSRVDLGTYGPAGPFGPGADLGVLAGAASGPGPVSAAVSVSAEDCAYVMFTSGSTGRPKPVAIAHRGVVRLVFSEPELPPPGPGDTVLHGYGLSSDASTIEIWAALVGGARLELVDRVDLLCPEALERCLREGEVTVAFLTTGVFHHIARNRPTALSGLRFLSAGGEAMDPDLARAVLDSCPGTTLVNFYGPTENTVVSTAHWVRPLAADALSVPIGRAFGGSQCYVLRPDGIRTEGDEERELFVGGDGLAIGYLGDPELTARAFTYSPALPGVRLYRTGDRVRQRADGLLEYLGRMDRQVKLRGQRIEPDEVEARLRMHDSVGEAVVELDARGATLVAYVTSSRPGAEPALADLRQYCARWLPPQAVPVLICRTSMPVTSAGKVDRRRLVAETEARFEAPPELAGAKDSAPAGVAATVAEVWQRVLRVRPAPRDDFFLLGGDSLLATEVVTRISHLLALDAVHASGLVRALLSDPTLAGFTEAVRGAREARPSACDLAATGFAREARLGRRLPPAVGPPPRPDRPAHVLLTGASGFVGAFLLDRLLRQTDAHVHCPVRARTPHHALRRVSASLARYGLDPAVVTGRVSCFPADLSVPGLGLEPAHRAGLGARLDLILHSAAQVNFLYPYAALRAANVQGTREIIRLAAPRRVPVHFLSTVAVLAGFGTAGVERVEEDDVLAHAERLTMGYAESKWVAEQLLREASGQGLPVAVYRPYEVTGDRRTGACNTETAICSLFKAIAEMGVAPDIPLPMDFVPVDHLTEAIVHIATRRPADGRTYHLTNPSPALLDDVLNRLRAAGCPVRTLPYSAWVDELLSHVAHNPTSPTAPFVSLCVDRGRQSDISVKEMYLKGTFPVLGRHNTERALSGSGLHCPPVDDRMLDRYLEYFFTSGYITRPAGTNRSADANRRPNILMSPPTTLRTGAPVTPT